MKENEKNPKVNNKDQNNKIEKNKKESKKETKKEKVKKEKVKKDKKQNKFIQTIKKKWLINGTKTLILVLIIIAIFITINVVMHNLELTPLDFSQEQLYTLTDETKEKVKNIDKDVNIYFIGYTDDSSDVDLAKQFNKANEKIVAEAVDIENRPDLAEKYGIETGTSGIIVECGDKSKVLTASDLVTYDMSTYETISIAEEKLTSAIISVTTDKIPKVYFLEGYSDFTLDSNMYYFNMYLQNEINEINTLSILSTGKVPDDCDTLVITTPNKDFDDVTTNAILEYINSGRNILWMNTAITENEEMPNVNKILATYGVNPFQVGIIRQTDASKMVVETPDLIMPDVQYSTITKDLYNLTTPIFINATKININEEALEELNVEKTDLLLASEDAYFRTDFNINSDEPTDGEEKGEFIVGAELDKTITKANEETGEKEVVSKLVIYGENAFVSDYQLIPNSQYSGFLLGGNKDLVLNSIAYLVDREDDITVRKSTGTVTYTATEQQDTIVRAIIFTVPALIILIGIIVWQVRRRKK